MGNMDVNMTYGHVDLQSLLSRVAAREHRGGSLYLRLLCRVFEAEFGYDANVTIKSKTIRWIMDMK